MAFCTSCGATLEGNAQFCIKCGAKQAAVAVGGGAAAAPSRAPQAGSNTVLKIVLIVVGAIVVLGCLATVGGFLLLRKVAKDSKVAIADSKGEARVVTPFGTVETSKDAGAIAEKLNVEVYPGAKALEGGSEVETMGIHAVTAHFETSDPPDEVAKFYREQYPKAIYTAAEGEHTLVVGDHRSKGGMITIHVKAEDGKTHLTIVNTSGKGMGPN